MLPPQDIRLKNLILQRNLLTEADLSLCEELVQEGLVKGLAQAIRTQDLLTEPILVSLQTAVGHRDSAPSSDSAFDTSIRTAGDVRFDDVSEWRRAELAGDGDTRALPPLSATDTSLNATSPHVIDLSAMRGPDPRNPGGPNGGGRRAAASASRRRTASDHGAAPRSSGRGPMVAADPVTPPPPLASPHLGIPPPPSSAAFPDDTVDFDPPHPALASPSVPSGKPPPELPDASAFATDPAWAIEPPLASPLSGSSVERGRIDTAAYPRPSEYETFEAYSPPATNKYEYEAEPPSTLPAAETAGDFAELTPSGFESSPDHGGMPAISGEAADADPFAGTGTDPFHGIAADVVPMAFSSSPPDAEAGQSESGTSGSHFSSTEIPSDAMHSLRESATGRYLRTRKTSWDDLKPPAARGSESSSVIPTQNPSISGHSPQKAPSLGSSNSSRHHGSGAYPSESATGISRIDLPPADEVLAPFSTDGPFDDPGALLGSPSGFPDALPATATPVASESSVGGGHGASDDGFPPMSSPSAAVAPPTVPLPVHSGSSSVMAEPSFSDSSPTLDFIPPPSSLRRGGIPMPAMDSEEEWDAEYASATEDLGDKTLRDAGPNSSSSLPIPAELSAEMSGTAVDVLGSDAGDSQRTPAVLPDGMVPDDSDDSFPVLSPADLIDDGDGPFALPAPLLKPIELSDEEREMLATDIFGKNFAEDVPLPGDIFQQVHEESQRLQALALDTEIDHPRHALPVDGDADSTAAPPQKAPARQSSAALVAATANSGDANSADAAGVDDDSDGDARDSRTASTRNGSPSAELPDAYDLEGRTLGKLELREKLGQGAVGTVYRGLDRRLDKEVAVKVLPRAFGSDPATKARFVQEAKTLAKFEPHPNITAVYDVDEQDGLVYIVMQYVRGESLASQIRRRGQLSEHQTIAVIRQVLHALDYAHSKGLIHRDIKPDNVLITDDGTAKLTDFGLAGAADPTSTKAGVAPESLAGTPQYLAPEVLDGETTDFRSDLFSLGVSMYECLTGKRPFDGPNLQAIVVKLHTEEPRPVTELNPKVGPVAEAVILKLMQKQPQNRFESAADVLNALSQWSAGDAMGVIDGHRRSGQSSGMAAYGSRGSGTGSSSSPIPTHSSASSSRPSSRPGLVQPNYANPPSSRPLPIASAAPPPPPLPMGAASPPLGLPAPPPPPPRPAAVGPMGVGDDRTRTDSIMRTYALAEEFTPEMLAGLEVSDSAPPAAASASASASASSAPFARADGDSTGSRSGYAAAAAGEGSSSSRPSSRPSAYSSPSRPTASRSGSGSASRQNRGSDAPPPSAMETLVGPSARGVPPVVVSPPGAKRYPSPVSRSQRKYSTPRSERVIAPTAFGTPIPEGSAAVSFRPVPWRRRMADWAIVRWLPRILAVLAVVGALGTLAAIIAMQPRPRPSVPELLPGNTVAYVHSTAMPELIEWLKGSRLLSTPRDAAVAWFGAGPEVPGLIALQLAGDSPLDSVAWQEWLRQVQEAHVALVPVARNELATVWLVKLPTEIHASTALARIADHARETAEGSGLWEIERAAAGHVRVFARVADRYLLASTHAQAAQSIQTLDEHGGLSSLAMQSDFRAWQRDGKFDFSPVAKPMASISGFVRWKALLDPQRMRLPAIFGEPGLAGAITVGVGSGLVEGVPVTEWAAQVKVCPLFDLPLVPRDSWPLLELVPTDAGFVAAGQIVPDTASAQAMWRWMQVLGAQASDLRQSVPDLLTSGSPLPARDEFFSSWTGEWTAFRTRHSRYVLGFGIEPNDDAQWAARHALRNLGTDPWDEAIDGVRVMKGQGFAWAVGPDWALISTDATELHDVLKAGKDRRTLGHDASFRRQRPGLGHTNDALLAWRAPMLLDVLFDRQASAELDALGQSEQMAPTEWVFAGLRRFSAESTVRVRATLGMADVMAVAAVALRVSAIRAQDENPLDRRLAAVNLRATVDGATVTLAWDLPDADVSYVAVEQLQEPMNTFEEMARLTAEQAEFRHENQPAGATYRYRLRFATSTGTFATEPIRVEVNFSPSGVITPRISAARVVESNGVLRLSMRGREYREGDYVTDLNGNQFNIREIRRHTMGGQPGYRVWLVDANGFRTPLNLSADD